MNREGYSMRLFQDLVARCQAGGVEARRELYQLRSRQVLAWAKRLARRGVDPEDVTHEVFAGIFSGKSGFRGESSFDRWLFRITQHAACRRPTLVERFTVLFDTPPEPEVSGEREDPWMRAKVRRALERLPEGQRLAVVLYVVEERTGPEVAELLDIPEGTVRSRVRHALSALEQALRREGIVHPRIETQKAVS